MTLAEQEVLRDAYESSREGWKTAAGDALSDVEGLRAKLGTPMASALARVRVRITDTCPLQLAKLKSSRQTRPSSPKRSWRSRSELPRSTSEPSTFDSSTDSSPVPSPESSTRSPNGSTR